MHQIQKICDEGAQVSIHLMDDLKILKMKQKEQQSKLHKNYFMNDN